MIQMTQIDKRCFPSLSRVFSPIVLNDLVQRGRSDYLDEVVSNSGVRFMIDKSQRMRDFFDELFNLLSRHYCSEYIYRNALAEQVYLGKHFESSHMLTELRVANCKADVVILNGTSTVYEIKSDLDTLDRLDDQISAYTCFFDHTNVITSLSQAEKLRIRLSPDIGIMALDSDNSITVLRESQSNKSHVKPSVIFGSLRKSEYLHIIKDNFGTIPDVPNTRIHRACFELFCQLSPEIAHDTMLDALQRRGNTKQLKDFVHDAPRSLKACAASYSTRKGRISQFRDLLDQSAHSVLSHVRY